MKETVNTNLPYSLPVECRCVPESPFYVRWLNRFGGIDYWMFQRRQEQHRKQSSYEEFEPYIADYAQAHGTNYPYTKECSESVIAAAGGLDENEWYEISRIAFAPMVQWFDERTRVWIDIMVDKSDNSRYSDIEYNNEIEITFLLPKPQLQF